LSYAGQSNFFLLKNFVELLAPAPKALDLAQTMKKVKIQDNSRHWQVAK